MLAIATTASTSFLAVSGLIPSQDSRNFAQAKKIQPLATEAAEFGLETLPMDDGSMSEAAPSLFDVRQLAGVSSPLGFWDPAGFSQDVSEGKIRFYREVEIKHGRLAMLSSVGFVVAEQFHPLFGGEVDVPSYVAFQETPLLSFWPTVVVPIAIIEIFSVFSFVAPFSGGAPVPVSWPGLAMLLGPAMLLGLAMLLVPPCSLVPPCLASALTARDLSLANRHRRDI